MNFGNTYHIPDNRLKKYSSKICLETKSLTKIYRKTIMQTK